VILKKKKTTMTTKMFQSERFSLDGERGRPAENNTRRESGPLRATFPQPKPVGETPTGATGTVALPFSKRSVSAKFSGGVLIRTVLCLILLGATTTGVLSQGKPNKGKPKKAEKAAAESTKLFAASEVLRLRIEIPEKGMETLKKYQWTFGPQQEREAVQVTIREGNLVYTNVALWLKGAAGSFRAIDDKPAFTVNFDRFADGQRFHGLQKLSLNNSVQDPTYVSEQFCREAFLNAGVPVPRATHARVELNGRDLGP